MLLTQNTLADYHKLHHQQGDTVATPRLFIQIAKLETSSTRRISRCAHRTQKWSMTHVMPHWTTGSDAIVQRLRLSVPLPPWYHGPTNRRGDFLSIVASASFPST